MIDPKEDVNSSAPSPEQQTVQEPVEETTVEQPVAQEQETLPQPSATPEAVTQDGDVDEYGVPYKNRYMEAMRYKDKYKELETNLPNIIQQAVREAIPQQQVPQQPQYTEDQLIQFKESSTDSNARAWAELELRKIADRKTEERFRSILDEKDKKDRTLREQQSAYMETQRKYPLMFNPDGSINPNHPLAQRTIQLYNSRPAFKSDSMGILGAADMAFADYALQQQPQLAQQQKQLKRQIKKLEKGTLIEGGGQPVQSSTKNPVSSARENFLKSKGTEKDLTSLTKELLRARGMIPES
jgi:hypothetical protein